MASRRRVPLLAGGLVVVGLVVAALVVAALRGPAEYDPATPEGTAQGYLEAVFDGDRRAAEGYLAEDLRDRCRVELREMWTPEAGRAILDETYLDGDRAEVDVTIRFTGPPSPFPDTGEGFDVTLVMTRTEAGWAISEVPWPLFGCDWREAP